MQTQRGAVVKLNIRILLPKHFNKRSLQSVLVLYGLFLCLSTSQAAIPSRKLQCPDCNFSGTKAEWLQLIEKATATEKERLKTAMKAAEADAAQIAQSLDPRRLSTEETRCILDDRLEYDGFPDHLKWLALDSKQYHSLIRSYPGKESELKRRLGLRSRPTLLSAGVLIKLKAAFLVTEQLTQRVSSGEISTADAVSRVREKTAKLIEDAAEVKSYVELVAAREDIRTDAEKLTQVGSDLVGTVPGLDSVITWTRSVMTVLSLAIDRTAPATLDSEDTESSRELATRLDYEILRLQRAIASLQRPVAELALGCSDLPRRVAPCSEASARTLRARLTATPLLAMSGAMPADMPKLDDETLRDIEDSFSGEITLSSPN